MAEIEKPFRERRAARWLARVGVVLGCAVALGGGYAAAAGGLGSITVFTTDLTGGQYGYRPYGLAAGPDGNLWFSAISTNANSVLGRVSTDGTISEFTAGLNAGSNPIPMAEGPDGNVWFGDIYPTPAIGKITPDGTISELATSDRPSGLAAGPDGNVWFTDGRKIGKITPGGQITEYSAGLNPNGLPDGIAAGSDGAMWFTDEVAAIGRITASGVVTEYSTGQSSQPTLIASGPDGNMWFLDNASIGRITPSGQITRFALPGNTNVFGMMAGPDGNLWFTDQNPSHMLGRITPDGTITEFDTSSFGFAYLLAIAVGSDGKIWLTGLASSTGVPAFVRIDVGAPAASIVPPAVTGSGQQGDPQSCAGAQWSDWAGRQPSTSAFVHDGYQWRLDGTDIPGQTGQTYTPSANDVGHQLSCRVTATYTLFPTSVSATSAPVNVLSGTTTSGGGGGGGSGASGGSTGPAAPAPSSPPPPSRAPATGSTPTKSVASVTILGITTVHLAAKPPKLHVTLKASVACTVTLTVLSPTGKTVAGWKLHLVRGTTKLALVIPLKARHKGLDTLRVQTGTGKAKILRVALRP